MHCAQDHLMLLESVNRAAPVLHSDGDKSSNIRSCRANEKGGNGCGMGLFLSRRSECSLSTSIRQRAARYASSQAIVPRRSLATYNTYVQPFHATYSEGCTQHFVRYVRCKCFPETLLADIRPMAGSRYQWVWI